MAKYVYFVSFSIKSFVYDEKKENEAEWAADSIKNDEWVVDGPITSLEQIRRLEEKWVVDMQRVNPEIQLISV
ncbi:MAG TPA: hypothetical protein VD928_01455, partial [Candidatus Paceibacterota bacterium]|nr:hypothetical protein [Candidatus Paceibacterota bacterium]